jgi:hypothetical protein
MTGGSPPGMMLKEILLDADHRAIDVPVEADLDEAVRRLKLDHRTESSKERYARLAAEERRDRLILVFYTFVVALWIASTAISFLATSSRVLEVMFSLSIIGGPLILYQRLSLTYIRLQSEFLPEMCHRKERLKQKNDELKVNVEILSQKTIELKNSEDKLKAVAKKSGYSSATVALDLFHENVALIKQKQAILEAIALLKITRIILTSDMNRDHIIGEVELNLLAMRIDAVAGSDIPFTVEELCNRFRRVQLRSLGNLAVTAHTLYVEKRRQQEKNLSRHRY